MARRINGQARGVVYRAQEQARRLGQGFIGCEHLLYGLAGAEDVAGSVLRAKGLTPERIEEQVASLIGRSRAADADTSGSEPWPRTGLGPGGLDGDALNAIGIDLDAVRARIEEAFGPGALDRPSPTHGAGGGHLRVTRQARKCLDRSIRAVEEAPPADTYGSEHIALALLAMDASVPRRIFAALGVSAPQLAAEIKEAL